MTEGPPFEKSRVLTVRAKDRPLNVTIRHTSWERYAPEDLTHAFDTFLPSARLRSLRLEESHKFQDKIRSLVLSCKSPAPHLTKLELLDVSEYYLTQQAVQSLVLPPDMFGGDAPVLQHIHLSGQSLNWQSTLFTDLKTLKLWNPVDVEAPTWDHLNHIFNSCPNLEELSLVASVASIPEAQTVVKLSQRDSVSLPQLRQLHLGSLDPNELNFILQTLNIPALHILCLTDLADAEHFAEGLQIVQGARYPVLRGLKIIEIGTSIPKQTVMDFFRRLPTIEELEIHGPDGLVQAMFYHDMDHAPEDLVLPNLQCLMTKGHNGMQHSTFVRQRKALGGKLQKVLADWNDVAIFALSHQEYLLSVVDFGQFNAFETGVLSGYYDSDSDSEDYSDFGFDE